jgi:hypothetical protein
LTERTDGSNDVSLSLLGVSWGNVKQTVGNSGDIKRDILELHRKPNTALVQNLYLDYEILQVAREEDIRYIALVVSNDDPCARVTTNILIAYNLELSAWSGQEPLDRTFEQRHEHLVHLANCVGPLLRVNADYGLALLIDYNEGLATASGGRARDFKPVDRALLNDVPICVAEDHGRYVYIGDVIGLICQQVPGFGITASASRLPSETSCIAIESAANRQNERESSDRFPRNRRWITYWLVVAHAFLYYSQVNNELKTIRPLGPDMISRKKCTGCAEV